MIYVYSQFIGNFFRQNCVTFHMENYQRKIAVVVREKLEKTDEYDYRGGKNLIFFLSKNIYI